MSFLYPAFLFALAAVAIPVIIHLFNFRSYKTVYFSNLNFLKNIKQETKARSQLKHLLVLLMRILAIAAIVIAFAQPYIPVSDAKVNPKKDMVGIYIDNSFSMDAESRYGKLIEVAKKRARSIAEAYPANTDFVFLTNDFEIKHRHWVSREQLTDFLAQTQVSPRVKKLSQVVSRQSDFLRSENRDTAMQNTLYILSDFQKSSSDFSQIKATPDMHVNLLPLSTQAANNLYIDSCWFESPNRKINNPEEIHIAISNASPESYTNIPVKLFLNDSLKALSTFNIQANSSVTIPLSYTISQTGILHGRIEITDYPITYDNQFYFSYSISDKINILTINANEPNPYLNALLASDENFELMHTQESKVQPSLFSEYQVIVLNSAEQIASGAVQELANFVSQGGTLLFFPAFEGNLSTYNALLQQINSSPFARKDTQRTRIEHIDYENMIYDNSFEKIESNPDLPVILKHFKLARQTQSMERPILTTQNNDPVLSVVQHGKGKAYIFAMPLAEESGNFAKHKLFVPTLYNMLLFSRISSKIYHIIGKDEVVNLNKNYTSEEYNVFHISSLNGEYDFIPQIQKSAGRGGISLNVQQNIRKADNYKITNNGDVLDGAAFNYNRSESDLSYWQPAEIHEQIEKMKLENFSLLEGGDTPFLTKKLRQISRGRQLWKWFVVLALIFLAAEIALLRLWK